jgi:FecR protein
MTPSKNCIATKAAALVALLLATRMAVAEPVGVVNDSTGPLLAKSASGSIRVLVVGSSVSQLDTLVSRRGVYARVTLTDHTDLALGPDTELAIEKYSFHDKDPQANTALLRLVKGSVRVTSGTLGTPTTDTFTLAAGATTVAIHRSIFVATYIEQLQGTLGRLDQAPPRAPTLAAAGVPATDAPHGHSALLAAMARPATGQYLRVSSAPTNPTQPLELTDSPIRFAQNVPSPSSSLNPGLYVQVLDGAITLSNAGGSQNFAAGQFGFTPGFQQPPVILPNNPGLQFTPPPSFSSTTGSQGSVGGSKPGDVDCQVR